MSELRDKKELYDLWDSLYRKLKTIDEAALLLEQNIKDASAKEAIQGYLASIGLSMIKDLYMQNTGSIGFLLTVRCIIEGLAVYLYIEKEKVSDEQNEIFKLQSYFIEKKIYTRYPDLDGVLFDLNQINENFKNTIQLISTKFDFSSIQIKELLKSKIPFLGNVKSFEKLIREYLDDSFLVFYKSISLFVHPYDYRLKDSNLCTSYAIAVFKMLEFLFRDVKPSKIGLEFEYNRVIGYNEFGFQARKITHLQREKLHDLSKLLDESNMAFLAFSIYESSMILFDYLLDISFGNTEQCTIKWKSAIENLWVFDLCLKDEVFARKNELLFYHSQLKNKQNLGIELNDQDFIDAFKHYQVKYLSGCNFDLFKKRFSSLTGYTINEKGQTISLKTAIYALIEDLSKNINEGTLECLVQQEPFLIPTEEDYKNKTRIQISSFLKMKYDESQSMSHASGYLYYCLSGAWYDGNILGYLYDELLQVLLKQLLIYLQSEYNKKKIEKVLVNYLRNFLKFNYDCILKKKQLYLMPKVRKNY